MANYSRNTTEQNIAQLQKMNYSNCDDGDGELTEKKIESFRKDVVQYDEVEKLIKTIQLQIKPLQEAMKSLKVEKKGIDILKYMSKL